jgi:hypothetical protein
VNLTTADFLFAAYAYVSYRSTHSDVETVKDAMAELQNNNIDVSQLLEFKADHCKQAES